MRLQCWLQYIANGLHSPQPAQGPFSFLAVRLSLRWGESWTPASGALTSSWWELPTSHWVFSWKSDLNIAQRDILKVSSGLGSETIGSHFQ